MYHEIEDRLALLKKMLQWRFEEYIFNPSMLSVPYVVIMCKNKL